MWLIKDVGVELWVGNAAAEAPALSQQQYSRRVVTAKVLTVFQITLQYLTTMDHRMKESFYD